VNGPKSRWLPHSGRQYEVLAMSPENKAIVRRGDIMGIPSEFDGQMVFNPKNFMSLAARMNRETRDAFEIAGTLYGIQVGADEDVPFGKVWVVRDDGEKMELNFYIRVGLDGSAIPEISDRDPVGECQTLARAARQSYQVK
jgi:hypothetical protein